MNRVVLIYAAGRGSRMKHHTNTIPKCLLKINGKTIIEHQVESCLKAGLRDIVVILGYKGEAIKRILGRKARYVWNKKFATTQTLYSLHCSRKACKGQAVIHIDGDNYFDPSLLKRIVKSPLQNAQLIDFNVKLDEEATKAVVMDKRLRYVDKSIPLHIASGECVGILKLGSSMSRKLYEQARKFARQRRFDSHVHNGMNKLLLDNFVAAIPTNNAYWIEIDFEKDLARAREMAQTNIRPYAKEKQKMRNRSAHAKRISLAMQIGENQYKQPRPKGRGILRTKNMRKRDATEVVYSENLWRPKSPQPKGRGFKFSL